MMLCSLSITARCDITLLVYNGKLNTTVQLLTYFRFQNNCNLVFELFMFILILPRGVLEIIFPLNPKALHHNNLIYKLQRYFV